ncbi:MAG TPA: DNA polymerase III subunit gamma/tau [Solirubrobacteraceae bacterium]|nr:DNA polymerase III subunit gamma/tau [Solirubrobacteraceae bacterium]
MTASASLYRRHRPRTFADVVGQDHVVRTLRNAIDQDKVHHAYLFVGSRGTGKTSMAKILAASLNCVNGPTISPCGECDACRGIASATSLDVIEMDAASNNSVDDIRDLREKVAYAPVSGHHKVYILDEAHMLTTAAWNAFLKTLEEPPPNTIFVLATTEANKVLPTVVDRCHRFDFSRPSVPQISTVLKRVAERESITIPDEATALIARSATGSFRDALGTLEQLLAYSGKEIALDDVLAVLGAADADLVFGAVDAIAAGQQRDALLAAARLAESGRDLGRFVSDLEAHARGLMVVQTLGEVPAELRITPEQDERLAEQARRVGPATVVRLLELIAGALRAMKDGADARTQLELALLKAAQPAYDPTVKALLARIERLESARPAPGAGGPASPVASPRAPSAPATAAARAAAPQRDGGEAAPEAGRTAVAVTAQVEGQPPVAAATTLPGASAGQEEATARAEQAAAAVSAELATETDPAPAVAAVAVVEPDAPAPEPSFAAGVELTHDALSELWPAVLESLQDEAPLLAAVLQGARPAGVAEGELTLAWPESSGFFKRKAEDPASKETIARVIRAVTGSSLRLAFELRDEAALAAGPAAPQLTEEELVNRFVEEFDAEVLPEEEST